MKIRISDFKNSDFFKYVSDSSEITFINGSDFSEFEFVKVSFDPIARSLRVLLIPKKDLL